MTKLLEFLPAVLPTAQDSGAWRSIVIVRRRLRTVLNWVVTWRRDSLKSPATAGPACRRSSRSRSNPQQPTERTTISQILRVIAIFVLACHAAVRPADAQSIGITLGDLAQIRVAPGAVVVVPIRVEVSAGAAEGIASLGGLLT